MISHAFSFAAPLCQSLVTPSPLCPFLNIECWPLGFSRVSEKCQPSVSGRDNGAEVYEIDLTKGALELRSGVKSRGLQGGRASNLWHMDFEKRQNTLSIPLRPVFYGVCVRGGGGASRRLDQTFYSIIYLTQRPEVMIVSAEQAPQQRPHLTEVRHIVLCSQLRGRRGSNSPGRPQFSLWDTQILLAHN